MNKKVIGLVGVGCLLMAGQASATLVDSLAGYQGPLYFQLTGYAQNVASTAQGRETWGAIKVPRVYDDQDMKSEIPLWAPNAGDRMFGTFYSIKDQFTSGSSKTDIGVGRQSDGFTLNSVASNVNLLKGPDDRIGGFGSNKYNGMGTSVLLKGNFSLSTGAGGANASVKKGFLATSLNTNQITDDFGGVHDMFYSFDDLLPAKATAKSGWKQKLTGWVGADAVPVPEPGTMLLFGTGLIALAGIGRKIRK